MYLAILDADGLVFDGAAQKQRVAREILGRDFPIDQCTKPILTQILGKDEYERLKEEAYNNPKWAGQFPLVVGAVEGIKALTEVALVVVVSRRRQLAAALSEVVLRKHGITVPVIGVGQKGARKRDAIASLSRHPNLYVDDDIGCLRTFGEDCPSATLALFRQPYNRSDAYDLGIEDWSHLVEYVRADANTCLMPPRQAFPELWLALVVNEQLLDLSKIENWESHTDSLTAVLQEVPSGCMEGEFSLRLLAPETHNAGARVIIARYAPWMVAGCQQTGGLTAAQLPTALELTQRTRIEMLLKAELRS